MENSEDNIGLRVASFAYYLDSAKDNFKAAKPPPNHTDYASDQAKDMSCLQANLRVDSFSFLNINPAENCVSFKVPGPAQDPTAPFSFSHHHEIPKFGGEIGVFGADKYFNMMFEYQIMTGLKQDHRSKHGTANLPLSGLNIKHETPSLCSEGSGNSQSALIMQNFPRIKPQTKRKTVSGRRILFGFGCPRPCFHKKDVYINEPKHGRTGSERADPFVLIPAPEVENSAVKKQAQFFQESRTSIDVFGSGTTAIKRDHIATNMERKLSMLTWDAIPTGAGHHVLRPPSSTLASSTFCDDMASDASSDLFEIENISSGSIFPLPMDEQTLSCMSPGSHYAPSEASIQWSVVTASAADFSSVLSYSDEKSVYIPPIKNESKPSKITRSCPDAKEPAQKDSRPGGGGILRCKSDKAVQVAEHARSSSDFKSRFPPRETIKIA